MNILNLCKKDYAGIAMRLTDAINKHTPHKSRLITCRPHQFKYPKDIETRKTSIIKKWVDWADIVHGWPLNLNNPLCQIPNKKLIWTYFGSSFRLNRHKYRQLARTLKVRELVATPDLLHGKNLTWLPNAVPVDEWFNKKTHHVGRPIICQTPSGRVGKKTDEILSQITDKKNVDILIVEGVSWEKCMLLKSKADIYVGEFDLGYGMSELEAMAMKIPLITHLEPINEKRMKRQIGPLPHYDCPLENLSDGIDRLLSNKALYEKHADLGFEYVKRFHDYPVVAKKFIELCEEL